MKKLNTHDVAVTRNLLQSGYLVMLYTGFATVAPSSVCFKMYKKCPKLILASRHETT